MPTSILFGTKNKAKLAFYKEVFSSFTNVQVLSLNDFPKESIPSVEETGVTAEENAKLKALAYSTALNMYAVSVDEALYIDGLSSDEQPGTKVRRFCSERPLSDQEMIEMFLNKTSHLDGVDRGVTWVFAICLSSPEKVTSVSTVKVREVLAKEPTLPIPEGYPLSSLLYNTQIQKMRKDFTEKDQARFNEPICKALASLIQEHGFTPNSRP